MRFCGVRNAFAAYVAVVDELSEFTGRLAGWTFCAVGLFVCFEVFMRYVLTQPTVWVDEISRIAQVWCAYLAISYVLKRRDHVIIDIVFRDTRSFGRLMVETFALLVVIFFSVVAAKFGWDVWMKSTTAGHTTDTYLAVPKVFTESSIWVSFGLLALQAVAEIIKVWTVGLAPSASDSVEG